MSAIYSQPACAASSASLPPSYSASSASPPYTSQPTEQEQRLDYVAVPSTSRQHSGVFTKRTRRLAVTLSNQEDGIEAPVYARNALISGEIEIDEPSVLAISVKLEGRQTVSVAELSPKTRTLFSQSHELWTRSGASECPRKLGFDIPFPTTFEGKEGSHPMPPSFDSHFCDAPGLHADITYSLTVKVTRPRLGSWKQHKTMTIPIMYKPRSRPYMPISPELYPFLSTVKTAPEEWHQITSTMPSRDDSVGPIDCHLFVPAVQIYGLKDTIPFHLQLRGSPQSLSAFLGLPSDPSSAPAAPLSKTKSRTKAGTAKLPPRTHLPVYSPYRPPAERPSALPTKLYESAALYPWSLQSPYLYIGGSPEDLLSTDARRRRDKERVALRVYILRQVSVQVHGQKGWRNRVIAEGALRPVGAPPAFGARADEACVAVDWEGELLCADEVAAPSFLSGGLSVKDFIVVQLCPPHPERAAIAEHQFSHPIRLVTDTYRDAPEHPSSR